MNLKKLAKVLDLSFSTVSKALRDSHEISAATKLQVQAKAKELNYQVNPLASSLRSRKNKIIAVVIPEVVNDFFGLVLNGIESIALVEGYHILIYLTNDDIQKEMATTRLLQNGRVDGIIISLSEQTSDTDHLEEIIQKEIPMVFFDRISVLPNCAEITTDDINSGFNATKHLIENGCKRIACLSLSQNLSITKKRINGYQQALKRHAMELDNSLVLSFDEEDEIIKNQIRKLLDCKNRPDGVFACVEKLAIATYEVCGELNLNIPKDVKVITFSNSYMAAFLNPSLTTISQPGYEIGREAAILLIKLSKKRPPYHPARKVEFKSTLIERNSTRNISSK